MFGRGTKLYCLVAEMHGCERFVQHRYTVTPPTGSRTRDGSLACPTSCALHFQPPQRPNNVSSDHAPLSSPDFVAGNRQTRYATTEKQFWRHFIRIV